MKKKYFGTDGVRGRAGKFPIVESFFFNLAVALKKTRINTKKILIGTDTRISSSNFEGALRDGFKKMKINCDFVGVVSTPVVSFYTKFLKYDFGIMISASHNPYHDNGIKIFKKNGEKLSDKEELIIEKNLDSNKIIPKISKLPITYKRLNIDNYKDFLIKKFNRFNLSKIKVLIDCANGSVFKFAPDFFREFGCNVICYSNKPNGKNINKNCGATFPNRLAMLTKKHNADIGLSFDGDADRVVISDEKGKIIDGDKTLAIICKYKKKEKFSSIVSTKMSNLAFRDFIKKLGIKLFLSNVGDRYVIEKMKKKKSKLGGEPSGHIIFSENGYCGDGILTGIYIMDILKKSEIKLSQLSDNLYERNYQKLINLKTKSDPDFILKRLNVKKMKKDYLLENNTDLLIRKSGTENLIRIMAQSSIKSNVQYLMKEIVKTIKIIDE